MVHCVFSSYEEITPQKPALCTFNLLFRGERVQTYPRHSFAKSLAIKIGVRSNNQPFYDVTNSSGAGRSSTLFYTRTRAGFSLLSFTTACTNIKLFDLLFSLIPSPLLLPPFSRDVCCYILSWWTIILGKSDPG